MVPTGSLIWAKENLQSNNQYVDLPQLAQHSVLHPLDKNSYLQ